jgi:hypothetical protein
MDVVDVGRNVPVKIDYGGVDVADPDRKRANLFSEAARDLKGLDAVKA